MQKIKKICVIMCALLFTASIMQSKKCKEYESLVVKCALTVCGKINGANMGQLLAYGNFINDTNGTTIVVPDEDVPFTNDTVPPIGMSHGAAPFTAITINESGIYSIFYKVRIGVAALATQIYLNGSPLFGTDDSGFTTTIDGILFVAKAGDILTLHNIGNVSIDLTSVSGTTPPVSLELMRIA